MHRLRAACTLQQLHEEDVLGQGCCQAGVPVVIFNTHACEAQFPNDHDAGISPGPAGVCALVGHAHWYVACHAHWYARYMQKCRGSWDGHACHSEQNLLASSFTSINKSIVTACSALRPPAVVLFSSSDRGAAKQYSAVRMCACRPTWPVTAPSGAHHSRRAGQGNVFDWRTRAHPPRK